MATISLLSNPKKRRTKKRAASRARAVTVKVNPAPRRRRRTFGFAKVRRYRRNPSIRTNKIMSTVVDGAIGAAGSIATNMLLNKLPIPANMRSGILGKIVELAGGIAVGMIVAKVAKKPDIARKMTAGATTIAMHSVLTDVMSGGVFGGGALPAPQKVGYFDEPLGYYDTAGEDDNAVSYSSDDSYGF